MYPKTLLVFLSIIVNSAPTKKNGYCFEVVLLNIFPVEGNRKLKDFVQLNYEII